MGGGAVVGEMPTDKSERLGKNIRVWWWKSVYGGMCAALGGSQ